LTGSRGGEELYTQAFPGKVRPLACGKHRSHYRSCGVCRVGNAGVCLGWDVDGLIRRIVYCTATRNIFTLAADLRGWAMELFA